MFGGCSRWYNGEGSVDGGREVGTSKTWGNNSLAVNFRCTQKLSGNALHEPKTTYNYTRSLIVGNVLVDAWSYI